MKNKSAPRTEEEAKCLSALQQKGLLWAASTGPQLESISTTSKSSLDLKFEIPQIDNCLPRQSLPHSEIHAFALDSSIAPESKNWFAPISFCCSLLSKNIFREEFLRQASKEKKSLVAWIGRRTWPSAFLLEKQFGFYSKLKLENSTNWSWQNHSLFFDVYSKSERLEACFEILKSKKALIVICDISQFDFSETRRIQLAAKKSGSVCLGFLTSNELKKTNAYYSSWLVSPLKQKSHENILSWRISLKSIKGSLRKSDYLKLDDSFLASWNIELGEGYGQSTLYLSETVQTEIYRPAELQKIA